MEGQLVDLLGIANAQGAMRVLKVLTVQFHQLAKQHLHLEMEGSRDTSTA
jgi:uncharacterized protein YhfF